MKKNKFALPVTFFQHDSNMNGVQVIQGSFASIYKRYGKNEPYVGESIFSGQLTAWKNERVYAHLILWSQTDADILSYEVSPLSSSTDTIAAEAVQLFFAGNVLADRYARGCGTYPQPRITEFVEIADALSKSPVTHLAPDDPLKIWVHIDVPGDIHPGIYSGSIKVRQNDRVQLTFTLHIEVLDKSLPEVAQWTYHLDLWQYPFQRLYFYNRFHPDEEIGVWSAAHFKMIEPLYRLLTDVGQKVITAYITDGMNGQPSMVKWILESDNSWTYDFTALDAWIDLLTGMGISGQINCSSIIGGAESLPYYNRRTSCCERLDMPMFSETYYRRWDDFLTAFKIHMTKRNLFDKTVIYLDEVAPEPLSRIIPLIHGNDPGWKIGLAYFHELSREESDALYDISGIMGNTFDAVRQGKVSTFYTSCAQTVPNTYVTPGNALAESAWMAWHAANQNLDGYLRWAYDLWTLDDPRDCRDSVNTSGDNMFVYRSTDETDAEIRISYRLEMLRKGIQDFEKIQLLKKELQLSRDPFDRETLDLLNGFIAQFHENSATGATSLVREGTKLLNDIARGDFPSYKILGDALSDIFIRRVEVSGSTTPLGSTRVENYPGGYSHYAGGRITVLPGGTVSVTIENTPACRCAMTAVWVDWNGNFDFSDERNPVWSAGKANTCDNPISSTFEMAIPPDTRPGVKRMRIQVRDSFAGAPTPCGDVPGSSTRDFDIVVEDFYGMPVTRSNRFYFLRKASVASCAHGLNYVNDVMPRDGYVHSDSDALIVEKGASFLLDIENSALSGLARTAVWIDWNRNNSFDEEGKLIALLGHPGSRDNPLHYRIPVTVPCDASAGETRMRIQLRDSREDVPQSCIMGQLTGTTDLKVIINEPSGTCCLPVLISPYNGEILTDTAVHFTWNANNHDVTGWKLQISNADSDTGLPVYFENSFDPSVTSALIPDLPQNDESLLAVLSWQIDGQWSSAATTIRAMDIYPPAMGCSGRIYFIYSISSEEAAGNISFLSDDSPENGYLRIKNPPLVVTAGSTFILDIEESFSSRCAFLKVWVDWDGNGDFTGPEDEVYADGLAESCVNSTKHHIRIPVSGNVSPGMKRLRIRSCDSWLAPLRPGGMNNQATTYDIDLEVRSAPDLIR